MNNERITRVSLNDVRQNEENPRSISEENLHRLVRSILEFPKMLQVRPVVTDETGLILGGNMRHKALLTISRMSEDEIMAEFATLRSVHRKEKSEAERLACFWKEWLKSPYMYAICETELTETDKREFVIKDNVHAGQWDYDLLGNFDKDDLQDWCVQMWGIPEPMTAPKLINTDPIADNRERIIVIFPKERRKEVEQLLRLPLPSKSAYKVSELMQERNDEDRNTNIQTN